MVLGRDNLTDAITTPRKTPFRTMIVDELSGFKNRSSVRWKTAHQIAEQPSMHTV